MFQRIVSYANHSSCREAFAQCTTESASLKTLNESVVIGGKKIKMQHLYIKKVRKRKSPGKVV